MIFTNYGSKSKEHIVPKSVLEADIPKSNIPERRLNAAGRVRYANLLYEKTEGRDTVQVRVNIQTPNRNGVDEPYWSADIVYPTFQFVRIKKVRLFYYRITSTYEVWTFYPHYAKGPLVDSGGAEHYAFRFFEEKLGTEAAELIAGVYEYMVKHHLLYRPGTD